MPNLANLTEAEQKCVSDKIPKLKDEGMSQEQAVAVAISKCAPDKKRDQKMMLTATHTAMGYQATLEDGVLTIFRVPIFCACKRGDFEADDKWIKEAVANALQAQRDGYMPPLHARHHEPSTDANDAVIAAGFFRVVGAEPITLKGARRTAVLADLIITNPGVQHDVLQMRYPYRSVEIFDVEAPPRIDSLALLDHEAPFLELPMLMVAGLEDKGDVPAGTFRQPWRMDAAKTDSPVVACFRRGHSAHLLFQQESEMTTANAAPEEKPAEAVGVGTTKPVQVELFQSDDDKPKDKKDNDNGENMEGEKLDVSAVVKAIESGEISVADMDAILAAIQAQGADKKEETPVEEMPAPAAAPGAEAMQKKPGTMTEQMAALAGENRALRADVEEMKAIEERKKDVKEAMDLLRDRPMGSHEDLEAEFMAYHKDHGPAAFAAYVKGLTKSTGILPPDTDEKGRRFDALSGKVPDVAMKYAEHGTDAVDKAAQHARDWEELKAHNTGMRTTQERYVEIQMAQEGLTNGR